MQLQLEFEPAAPDVHRSTTGGSIHRSTTGGSIYHSTTGGSIYFVRQRRARRYVLRVDIDGRVRVTIPRGGSRRDADAFARKNLDWIRRQQAQRDRAALHARLNWRLLRMPDWVRDYVLIHELMHLRRMDHSPQFWAHVAEACTEYESARQWLRANGPLLR